MSRIEQVSEYISNNPGCTRRQVAEGIGACYVYVSLLVADLARQGRVEQTPEPVEGKRPGRRTIQLTAIETNDSNEEQ